MSQNAWMMTISAVQKVGLPAVIALLLMYGGNNFANRFLDEQARLVDAISSQGQSLARISVLQERSVEQLERICYSAKETADCAEQMKKHLAIETPEKPVAEKPK